DQIETRLIRQAGRVLCVIFDELHAALKNEGIEPGGDCREGKPRVYDGQPAFGIPQSNPLHEGIISQQGELVERSCQSLSGVSQVVVLPPVEEMRTERNSKFPLTVQEAVSTHVSFETVEELRCEAIISVQQIV